MSGFGTLQPRTGNKDSVRLEEVIVMHKWPADEWSQVRFMPGKILPVKRHWITLMAGGKGGKEKREVTVPRYCIAFDVNNENEPRKNKKGKEIKCPYCTLEHGKDAAARYEFFYLANAIIREVQEDMPARALKIERTKDEKKTGFKDIRSKTWTPVQVCRITSSVAARIKELGDGNFVKKGGDKKAYDVTHEKYGIDIRVKFKPKGAGTDKYSADKDERTPLTDDEKKYLIWRLDESLIDATGRMDEAQALEDFKRMEVAGGEMSEEEDDDGYSLGDDDDDSGKKSKKSKKSSKKTSKAFDDDEDDAPKKSKKKKPSKPAFADDDDDDDDDDEPKKTKKSSKDKSSKDKSKKSKSKDSVKKSSKKSSKDDDDDEDDKPKKSSKKSSKSSDKKADKSKDKSKKSSKSKDEKSSKKDKSKDKAKKKKKSSEWDD